MESLRRRLSTCGGGLKVAFDGPEANPTWKLDWDYDRYGNRPNQNVRAGSPPGPQLTIDPNTNRITGTGFGYDANGNMTADGLNSLGYDAENRVVSVNAGATQYCYDGNGLRVKKVSGSTLTCSSVGTVHIFSGTKVIAEYENGAAPGSPTREYIYSGRQLLATIAGTTTTYHHADHLSVRLMTDGTLGSPTYGQTVGQRGLYPYGDSLIWYETGTTDKWKFTTYERDGESVNDYAMARYYINRFGRFSSPDPLAGSISDPQSLNRYAYVENDPIDAIDPDGREPTLTPADPCGHITPPFGIPPTFPTYDPFWIWRFLPSWFPGANTDDIWQFINPFLPPGTAYYQESRPQGSTTKCFGYARFTGVGPGQAPGRGALYEYGVRGARSGTVAIDPKDFGLPFPEGPQGATVREQTKATLASYASQITVTSLGPLVEGAPTAPYTVSDIVDIGLRTRGSAKAAIDVYRFPTNSLARQFTGTYPTLITFPSESPLDCPPGFVRNPPL